METQKVVRIVSPYPPFDKDSVILIGGHMHHWTMHINNVSVKYNLQPVVDEIMVCKAEGGKAVFVEKVQEANNGN